MKHFFIFIFFLIIHFHSHGQTLIKAETFRGFDDYLVQVKLDSALVILEEVVNSAAFEREILKAKFIRKQKKSNQEIFNLILSGQERNTTPDNIINLKLVVYNNQKREIGHTDSNDTIHTHKNYILENAASCYAAHLLHEYCHVLGFRHAFLKMPFRRKTVPYKVGNILSTLKGAECP